MALESFLAKHLSAQQLVQYFKVKDNVLGVKRAARVDEASRVTQRVYGTDWTVATVEMTETNRFSRGLAAISNALRSSRF